MDKTTGQTSGKPPVSDTGLPVDRKRFRRVRWFFVKVLAQVLWWDYLFSLPVLRWFRPPPLPRWQRVSRGYRDMAMDLGGVLIKLGQFLSTRIDLLPPEVTRELAGLQDSVAPEKPDRILAAVEAEFGRPVDDVFTLFARNPMGAASLAQAHLAVLPDYEEVIVKVLRPGIDRLVETDLAVIRLVCRWLKHFRYVRNRMDLDRLVDEFTATTREELDLVKEGRNLERFARDFEDDPDVCVPEIYNAHSTARILTMENVAYIKIGATSALEACGIRCSQVAKRLYDIYMKQIFETNFVHVDPHPGNLFVKPLPHPDEKGAGVTGFSRCDIIPYKKERPFQIVFIDFGMTAVIPDQLKTAMRTGAIGIGTQDARKLIQAYTMAGMLQPGADLRRLEEAHENWMQRIWGVRMGRLREVAFKEARYFLQEYRDLIKDTPFQFPSNLLFIGRAIGILSGISTDLDPEFDPWAQTLPYARRFAREELKAEWQGLPEEVMMMGRHMWKIPTRLDQVLNKARLGSLAVQVSLSPETRKAIRRIDVSVKRFTWIVLTAALLVAGVNLHIAGDSSLSNGMFVLSALSFIWGFRRE